MTCAFCNILLCNVAPYTGAWIEISPAVSEYYITTSLPTRERGLKLRRNLPTNRREIVAPYTGAWIEIFTVILSQWRERVAPYTGAWIEIWKAMGF